MAGWRTAGTEKKAGEASTPLVRSLQMLACPKRGGEKSAPVAAGFPATASLSAPAQAMHVLWLYSYHATGQH